MYRGKLMLIMALVMGLFTAGLSYYYIRNLTTSTPVAQKMKMAKVVVAKATIPSRTLITPDMVYLREMPEELIHPDALKRLDEAVGSIARSEILLGEQVFRSRILKKGEALGLVLSIPPGKRAVTVKVNEVIGVGGFVKPKDHVDILGTFSADKAGVDTTVTVLQDVEVLAVAQEMDDRDKGKAKVPTSVTLAVTPEEAEKVTLAEEIGSLRLALRPLFTASTQPPGVNDATLVKAAGTAARATATAAGTSAVATAPMASTYSRSPTAKGSDRTSRPRRVTARDLLGPTIMPRETYGPAQREAYSWSPASIKDAPAKTESPASTKGASVKTETPAASGKAPGGPSTPPQVGQGHSKLGQEGSKVRQDLSKPVGRSPADLKGSMSPPRGPDQSVRQPSAYTPDATGPKLPQAPGLGPGLPEASGLPEPAKATKIAAEPKVIQIIRGTQQSYVTLPED